MTRRELLKWGIRAGGYSLVSTAGPLPRTFASAPQSPRTDPFLDELPFPPEPQPVAPFTDLTPACKPFIDPAGKLNARFYKLVAEERRVRMHKQLPPTAIWGYRDFNVPNWNYVAGPTFRARVSETRFTGNVIRLINNLPSQVTGFGDNRITMHTHGTHGPSRSDGFPGDIVVNGVPFNALIGPGQFYDYNLPGFDPGVISATGGAISDRPSTLWYHDHAIDFTGANVYRGLAAFYLVYEEPGGTFIQDTGRDTGDETNNANVTNALRLPSGGCDIPLVLQDKMFAADGSLVFDPLQHDGFLGDKFLVNGAVQPFLRVKRRKYRFRFLNGSNARMYQVFLTNEAARTFPMTMIATEGGLMAMPIRNLESFLLGNAERVEVVVDFTMFREGETVYFENRLAQDDGRGPRGTFEDPELLPTGTRLMKIMVEETVPDFSRVPEVLRPVEPVSPADLASATVRTFEFDRRHGAWAINGEFVDLSKPVATPRLNAPEIWRFKNSSGGWWHPIHVHGEFGQILARNGRRPPLHEQKEIARKDTFLLGPNSELEVFFKWRDFAGPLVFHCHNLEHEDMFMMARFDIAGANGQVFL